MSRLRRRSADPHLDPVALDEIVPSGDARGPRCPRSCSTSRTTLPLLHADAGLLERALANLVANAVRHTPRRARWCVSRPSGSATTSMVRVVDHGPASRTSGKEQMFAAFQRLGDAPAGHGLGLGLAVAAGFVEAVGGNWRPRTPPAVA